jgi:hypothetical protein
MFRITRSVSRGLIFPSSGGKLRITFTRPPAPLAIPLMPPLLSAPEVLNREFLEIRSRILELAAAFDRLERADGAVDEDPRLPRLREALSAVLSSDSNRAEQVQLIFSRPYDTNWQSTFKMNGHSTK